jgi:hypothetical protein
MSELAKNQKEMRTIKKISLALILLVGMMFIFQRCQKDIENEHVNSSIEKHYVSIYEIRQMVNQPNFKNFKNSFQKEYLLMRTSIDDSLYILDYKEIKDSTNLTALYLTKLSDNSNVAFAADDRSHPVMSISDELIEIDYDSLPPAYINWLYEEADAIKFARDNNLEQTIEIKNEWQAMRIPPDDDTDPWECPNAYFYEKSPLLTTNWGQGVGYNNNCPNLGCTSTTNGRAWTGCVATAMAQIMKYNQHPSNYNWSLMPNNSGSNETSRLMRDIGDSVGMDYGCDGSGASFSHVVQSFMNNFNYSYATAGDYNYQTVRSNISQNKPVYLRGKNKVKDGWWFFDKFEGHAWVADGYRESFICSFDDNGNVTGGWGYLFFHMNWGWNGNNSWVGLNNFTTPNGSPYNYNRKMAYNINP